MPLRLADQVVSTESRSKKSREHYYDDIVRNGGLLVDGTNFNQKTSGKKGILIVYAEWCGHCQDFHSDVVTLAKVLKKTPMFLAVMDSDDPKNKVIMGPTNFKVKGYPSIYIIQPDGTFREYRGENRSVEAILAAVGLH